MPDLSRAEKLVELTLLEKFSIWERGTTVALWRAPTREGGECTYLAPATSRVSRTEFGATVCTSGRRGHAPPSGDAFATGISWTRLAEDTYSVLLQGRVSAGRGIAKVTLRSARGETALAFDNGHYLALLAHSSGSETLPPGCPYALVGYDAAGAEVARQDLQQLIARFRDPDG